MVRTRPTSRQFQGHLGALRASKSFSLDQTIDIASGNYAAGKSFPGVVGVSDPSWTGATDTFLVYLDKNDDLVLNDTSSSFPALCTRIARIIIASGVIIEIIDERPEVNGLYDAYQIGFDDTNLNIATPADDVQEAIELLDAYVWQFQSDVGSNIIKYKDLDIGGGVKNGIVRQSHTADVPALEFPKRDAGVARIRYMLSVPEDWVDGTDVVVKIYWSPFDSTAGNVRWRIRYKLLTSGVDGLEAAMTTLSVNHPSPVIANRLVDTGTLFTISSGDISKDDMLIVNVEREYSAEDTYESTAKVHLVRIEYTGRGIE